MARNYAIKSAKGRFIAFLDSDDKWYSNKLSLIDFMKTNKIFFHLHHTILLIIMVSQLIKLSPFLKRYPTVNI